MECSHGIADSDSQSLNGLCIPLVPFLSLICIVDPSYAYALWGKTTLRRQGCGRRGGRCWWSVAKARQCNKSEVSVRLMASPNSWL